LISERKESTPVIEAGQIVSQSQFAKFSVDISQSQRTLYKHTQTPLLWPLQTPTAGNFGNLLERLHQLGVVFDPKFCGGITGLPSRVVI
jgi:hypothetical protein